MAHEARPLAIVTGASAGIGYELARICAENGFDLVIAADQPKIQDAARDIRALGVGVEAVEADLATLEGATAFMPRSAGGRSRRFSPMPGTGSAAPFSIRTSLKSAMSSTPTSPGRFT
jgi:NAD(P)-dependent dehydrogenase (short-subunit alcohol dehydrogenase family)